MEMGLTHNQEHPCCHPPPRAAPWAGVHGGFAPGWLSVCRATSETGGASLPRTVEAALAGGPAGRCHQPAPATAVP